MGIVGLILDVGKVLVGFDHRATARTLAPAAGLDPAAIDRILFDSGLNAAFEAGRLDEEGFAAEALAALGRESGGRSRVGREALLAAWGGIFTREEENLRLLEPLARAFPLVLLSNTNPTHFAAACALAPELARVPGKVLSHEVRLAKPDPAIYRLALARLGLPADRVALVDDLPANLAPARELGMTALLHRPGSRLADTLAAAGVRA